MFSVFILSKEKERNLKNFLADVNTLYNQKITRFLIIQFIQFLNKTITG